MTVYEIIIQNRKLSRYSQKYVGEKIGLTQPSYSKLEKGTTELNYSKLEAIAKIYSKSVIEFLSFVKDEAENNNNPKEVEAIEKKYMNLIKRDKELISVLREQVKSYKRLYNELKGK